MNESGFLRHVRACNTARLPGDRYAFHLGGRVVGWIAPPVAEALAGFPDMRVEGKTVTLSNAAALPSIAKTLAEKGLYRWRREAFDVRAEPDGPVLSTIDRGAIPAWGIEATGVHVNGLVDRPNGLWLWIARRAANKTLDPGKLDHIVAGGVPAGLSVAETLVKEAAEEAAIPRDIAVTARPVSILSYAMDRPEGLRRDRLHCYDLYLPDSFTPVAADGEVESFELWPAMRALEAVRDTDSFKFNVNLVLIDFFIRREMIRGAEADSLRKALQQGAS